MPLAVLPLECQRETGFGGIHSEEQFSRVFPSVLYEQIAYSAIVETAMEYGSFAEVYRWQCACAGAAYSSRRSVEYFAFVVLGVAHPGSTQTDVSLQRNGPL